MPDNLGRIKKGERLSPSTEFKKGDHWRERKPFWDKEWLFHEYVEKQRSSGDIAAEYNVTDAAIIFWLRKHDIPRRDISDARKAKQWSVKGEMNGMYGKTGASNPRWRGGCTPERQSLYSSLEWADVVKEIWRRDKRMCQRCGVKRVGNAAFDIHHIVSFQVKRLRLEPSNLILLCRKCHRWVHSKENTNNDYIREVDE